MKSKPMHCEQAEILLAELVYDEIANKDEKASLVAHVEQCKSCAKKQTEMKISAGLLKEAIEIESKPKLSMSRRSQLLDGLDFEEDDDSNEGSDIEDTEPTSPIEPNKGYQLKFKDYAAVAACALFGASIFTVTQLDFSQDDYASMKGSGESLAYQSFSKKASEENLLVGDSVEIDEVYDSSIVEEIEVEEIELLSDSISGPQRLSDQETKSIVDRIKANKPVVSEASEIIAYEKVDVKKDANYIIEKNFESPVQASADMSEDDMEGEETPLGEVRVGSKKERIQVAPRSTVFKRTKKKEETKKRKTPIALYKVNDISLKAKKDDIEVNSELGVGKIYSEMALEKRAEALAKADHKGARFGSTGSFQVNQSDKEGVSRLDKLNANASRRGLKQLEIKGATSLAGYARDQKPGAVRFKREAMKFSSKLSEESTTPQKKAGYNNLSQAHQDGFSNGSILAMGDSDKDMQLSQSFTAAKSGDLNGKSSRNKRQRANENIFLSRGLLAKNSNEFNKNQTQQSSRITGRESKDGRKDNLYKPVESVKKSIASKSVDAVDYDDAISSKEISIVTATSDKVAFTADAQTRVNASVLNLNENILDLSADSPSEIDVIAGNIVDETLAVAHGLASGEYAVMNTAAESSKRFRDETASGDKLKSLSASRTKVKAAPKTTSKAQAAVSEFIKKPIFESLPVNPFVLTSKDKKSTFAMDTDTASYAIAKNYLKRGILPPPSSIRMEEFINAFDYNLPKPKSEVFSVQTDVMDSKFGKDLALLRVGIKGKSVGRDERQPAHFIYVIDTSGSMGSKDRLGLIKKTLPLMINTLSKNDYISIVTYGDKVSLLAEHVSMSKKEELLKTIESLRAKGATWLDSGHKLGYEIASRHFKNGAMNNVMLFSDGVANVGATLASELLKRVGTYRRQGISLTSVGFGEGSYNDALLEALANNGDGNYFYINSEEKAKEVFVDSFGATFQTMAKNAKIQVVFNPEKVRRFRLIGYENRKLKHKEFRVKDHSSVDAGEVNSGQNVVALYECELLQSDRDSEIASVSLRYRNTENQKVEEKTVAIKNNSFQKKTVQSHPHVYLSILVAEFAEFLRESEYQNNDLQEIIELANRVSRALPHDEKVQELKTMIHKCRSLAK